MDCECESQGEVVLKPARWYKCCWCEVDEGGDVVGEKVVQ